MTSSYAEPGMIGVNKPRIPRCFMLHDSWQRTPCIQHEESE